MYVKKILIMSVLCVTSLSAYATTCSLKDFKNEVETQVYLLEKQINHFASEENYNPDFWYAKGKLDVYLHIQEIFDQDFQEN